MALRKIKWADQWGLGEPHIWADVQKADRAWQLDGCYYIPASPPASCEKYHEFGRWFRAHDCPVWMPTASLLGKAIGFTDGRHRFAWLRDKGATAIPLTTDIEFLPEFEALVGSDERETLLHK